MDTSKQISSENIFTIGYLMKIMEIFPNLFSVVTGKIVVNWAVFGQLEDELYIIKRKKVKNNDEMALIGKYAEIVNLMLRLGIISNEFDRCFIIFEKSKQTDKNMRLGVCSPEFFYENSGALDLFTFGFCRRTDAISFMSVLKLRFPSETEFVIIPPKCPLTEDDRMIVELEAMIEKLRGGTVDMDRISRVVSFDHGKAEIDFAELFALIKEADLGAKEPNIKVMETLNRLMEELRRIDLITDDYEKGIIVLVDGEVVNPRIFLDIIALTRASDASKLKRYIAKRNGSDSSIRTITVHRASKIFGYCPPEEDEEEAS